MRKTRKKFKCQKKKYTFTRNIDLSNNLLLYENPSHFVPYFWIKKCGLSMVYRFSVSQTKVSFRMFHYPLLRTTIFKEHFIALDRAAGSRNKRGRT